MGCGTLAGLGLALAGAGTSAYANNQIQNKENDLASQELAHQQGFQKQAQAAVGQNIQNSGAQQAKQNQQQGAQQFLNASKMAQLPQLGLTAADPSQNVGASNVAQASQQAENELGQNANAQLQGYTNVRLQNQLGNLQTGNQLGMIDSNARAWTNALPLQLQQAAGSEQGLQALGSLLGTAGQVVGLSGLASAPKAATTPFGQFVRYPMANQMWQGIQDAAQPPVGLGFLPSLY